MIKGLIISLTIGVVVFLVVFLLTIDKNTMKSFQHMDEGFLLVAAAVIFISMMVEGLRIQVVTRAINENIGFWESVKIFYIVFFLGGITPYFSGAIPAQLALFSKKGIPIGKATMIATVRPIIKSIVFLIITPILFLYFRESLEEYELLSWFLLIAAILFSLFFIVLFILVVKNPQKIQTIFKWLKELSFLKKYLNKPGVEQKMKWIMFQTIQFQRSFHLLLGHPTEMFLMFLYTALYWFLYFLIAPLLLLAMGIQLDYALIMIIQVLIFFVLPFLPTPGGSGAAELGFASLFSFFVPENLLGIYVGGWRLFTFYINIIIGALLSLVELRKWAAQEKIMKSSDD
ncbi:MAG TPA: lysylphosphatidylglycerol synthase transmembrane domain-containing protein [Atribacterota bacterium]|nr:lysylphosphatidylglycerol synthase transmembrane domain-containing protein [Atribacterota bacterium]